MFLILFDTLFIIWFTYLIYSKDKRNERPVFLSKRTYWFLYFLILIAYIVFILLDLKK